MRLTFNGSVHFANGDPAAQVSVRIFDKDATGHVDDDLSLAPGCSDDRGQFSITYEPLRYLDYHTIKVSGPPGPDEENGTRFPDLGDIYLPYLRFDYTFNGTAYSHDAPMGIFQTKFYLPENPPVEFLPSTHGFMFTNSFAGYFLPFSTPDFLGSNKVTKKYGLCGGMCAAAYDFALVHKAIPGVTQAPHQGTKLQRYLYRRQMDSLGGLGQEVVKVARWTSLPDDTLVGTFRRSADEFEAIRCMLDQKNLVVLALIYVRATSLSELSKVIFENHQVLAYAYQIDADGLFTIRIYDPNLPGRDDVVIHTQEILLGEVPGSSGPQMVTGLKSSELAAGTHYRDVRGFFAMPYSPMVPPEGV